MWFNWIHFYVNYRIIQSQQNERTKIKKLIDFTQKTAKLSHMKTKKDVFLWEEVEKKRSQGFTALDCLEMQANQCFCVKFWLKLNGYWEQKIQKYMTDNAFNHWKVEQAWKKQHSKEIKNNECKLISVIFQ